VIKAYPSLFLLLFVVTGILLGDSVFLSPLVGFGAATVAAGLAVVTFLRGRQAAAALLAGSALGLVAAVNFCLQFHGVGPNHLNNILREPTLCQVYGQVADWPDLKQNRTEIEIQIDSLRPAVLTGRTFHEVGGRMLLKVSDITTALQRGDRIAFRARLYPVRLEEREDFDYGRYLNLRGIFAQAFLPTVLNIQVDRRPELGYWPLVDRVRNVVCESLQRNLGPATSALARGFLIGETRDIPSDVYARFRDSGTLHLLAVSGANVALVLLFSLWVMRPFWLGPTARAVILLVVIIIFTGVSYGDPSVVRASLMAALVLGARLLGRTYDLNNIIAATALAILLVQPTELFDVGFQLSFVTAWGLIFFVPRIGEAFGDVTERSWYRWLVMPVVASVVAQIVSTPLVLFYFQRIPLISLAANLVIVPIVSVGVIAVMVLLVVDMIWPILGMLVGSLVDLWLRGVLAALQFFGSAEAPVWKTDFLSRSDWGPWLAGLFYLALILLVVSWPRRWARRTLVVLSVIAVNVALATGIAVSLRARTLEVRIERVPGGLAVLTLPDQSSPTDLIVTGLSRSTGSSGGVVLESILGRAGITRLHRLIVLSADYDAVRDILRLARELQVDSVYVCHDLDRIVGDLQIRGDSTVFSGPLLFFGDVKPQVAGSGCYLGGDGVCLMRGTLRVEIAARANSAIPTNLSSENNNVLVIGSRWKPKVEDWIRLRQAGYDQIICADFEQPGKDTRPDVELDPDAVPPDYIIDLSRTSSARLSFGL
jgi:ComEC/Rec2-related protein